MVKIPFAEQENRRLVAELRSAQDQIRQLNEANEVRSSMEKKANESEREHLKLENDQLNKNLQTALHDIENLKEALDLSKSNDDANANAQKDMLNRLKQENMTLAAELKTAHQDLENMKELLELSSKSTTSQEILQKENERLKVEYENLKKVTDLNMAAKEEMRRLREFNEQLNKQLSNAQSEAENLKQELNVLKNTSNDQNEDLRLEIGKLQSRLNGALAEVETERQENKRLEDLRLESDKFKTKLKDAYAEVEAERKENERLKTKCKEAYKDFEIERDENDRLRTKVKDAREEVNKIRELMQRSYATSTTQAEFECGSCSTLQLENEKLVVQFKDAVKEQEAIRQSFQRRLSSFATQVNLSCETCNVLKFEKDQLNTQLRKFSSDVRECVSVSTFANDSFNSFKIENEKLLAQLDTARHELADLREQFDPTTLQDTAKNRSSKALVPQVAVSLPNRSSLNRSKPLLDIPTTRSSQFLAAPTDSRHEVNSTTAIDLLLKISFLAFNRAGHLNQKFSAQAISRTTF